MLLSIITRHCKKSFDKKSFERCIESVENQTLSKDIQHLFIVDEIGRGMEWAQSSLHFEKDKLNIFGKYIMFLDDDDAFLYKEAVEDIVNSINDEDFIIFQGKRGNKIYPLTSMYYKEPERGKICNFCFWSSFEIYNKCSFSFVRDRKEEVYAADFHYSKEAYYKSNKVLWILDNKPKTGCLKISRRNRPVKNESCN